MFFCRVDTFLHFHQLHVPKWIEPCPFRQQGSFTVSLELIVLAVTTLDELLEEFCSLRQDYVIDFACCESSAYCGCEHLQAMETVDVCNLVGEHSSYLIFRRADVQKRPGYQDAAAGDGIGILYAGAVDQKETEGNISSLGTGGEFAANLLNSFGFFCFFYGRCL